MTKINLLPHETIILRDSVVQHDRGGLIDLYSDELVLTNVALVVIHKSIMGGVKDIQRFSLDQIKVVNGVPQALFWNFVVRRKPATGIFFAWDRSIHAWSCRQ